MQHKNVWISTEKEKFIQTKIKRKSDGDGDNSNNELEIKAKKSKTTTILDFSTKGSSVSQSKIVKNVIEDKYWALKLIFS